MNIPHDKKLHLIGGLLFAVAAMLALAMARWAGPGWAIATAGIVMGWGVERYQAIRHEGTPDNADWLASSTPSMVLGLAIQVVLTVPHLREYLSWLV